MGKNEIGVSYRGLYTFGRVAVCLLLSLFVKKTKFKTKTRAFAIGSFPRASCLRFGRDVLGVIPARCQHRRMGFGSTEIILALQPVNWH